MTAKQIALIIASDAAHNEIQARTPSAYRIPNFADGVMPKTRGALSEALTDAGYAWEVVFDAAHGRRYVLFVYKADEKTAWAERTACWDCYAPKR